MNILKKAFVSLSASAVMMSGSLYAADELKILPIFTDANYCGQIEVAAVLQSVNFDNGTTTDTDNAYGAEISFDCPVFTLPGDHILRQQLTLSSYDSDGVGTSIEMNPYYFFRLQDNLQLGVGPGVGAIEMNDTWRFTYQAGAGLKYYVNKNVLVGADVRWQTITSSEDTTNTRVMAKVGYRF